MSSSMATLLQNVESDQRATHLRAVALQSGVRPLWVSTHRVAALEGSGGRGWHEEVLPFSLAGLESSETDLS